MLHKTHELMKLFVNMHAQSSPAGCRPEATSFIKTYTCIHLIHKQSILLKLDFVVKFCVATHRLPPYIPTHTNYSMNVKPYVSTQPP